METSERTRLEKLLGMLGSSFDGERANAARMIAAMAEAKKITINELIALAHLPASGQQQTKPSPQDDFTDVDKADDLLRMLKRIAEKPALAARVSWEIDYELSEKYVVVVIEKALREASWGVP